MSIFEYGTWSLYFIYIYIFGIKYYLMLSFNLKYVLFVMIRKYNYNNIFIYTQLGIFKKM